MGRFLSSICKAIIFLTAVYPLTAYAGWSEIGSTMDGTYYINLEQNQFTEESVADVFFRAAGGSSLNFKSSRTRYEVNCAGGVARILFDSYYSDLDANEPIEQNYIPDTEWMRAKSGGMLEAVIDRTCADSLPMIFQ